MTPDSDIDISSNSPSGCYFVIIGGKYMNMIGKVMEKVNSVLNYIGGIRPVAVFMISNKNKETVDIDVDYSFDRHKSTPVMVK